MKFTRAVLIDVRARSLRKRVWFRLTHMERSLMNLTIRVVDVVKSSRLGNAIGAILRKLEEAMGNSFLERVLDRGRELAGRFARIAYSWGNLGALGWVKDRAYVLYLGVSYENVPRMFRA